MWKMRLFACCLASVASIPALTAQGPERMWAPSDSVVAAASDIAKLPADQATATRYLDLGSVPVEERPALIQVLAGHVNSLSREPDLVAPVVVPGTRGALLRIDLRDYGWKFSTFGALADASPYHHVRIKTHTGADAWKNTALAPWLSETKEAAIATTYLAQRTQSRAPIVSGQWFLWQTSVQEGRGAAGYYDFLGVKDQKGFEALVRFDAKLASKLEQRRVVIFSGVTQEPRRVERTHTVLGGLWRTSDSAEAVDEKNPLNQLNGGLKADATEQFGPLPNGLPAWLLANGAGVRQDKAPDNIVSGDRTSAKDGRLHVYLSCWRCHGAGKASGVLDLDAAPIRELYSVDADKLRELRRQYLRDLQPLIDQDRQAYAAALKAATGLEPAKYAVELSRFYQRYDEARVDAAWAGRDFGMDGRTFAATLNAYRRASGYLLPSLSVIANGGAVPIRQWQEAVPAAWLAIKGVKR